MSGRARQWSALTIIVQGSDRFHYLVVRLKFINIMFSLCNISVHLLQYSDIQCNKSCGLSSQPEKTYNLGRSRHHCCNIVIYTLIAVALSSCQKRIEIFPSSNCVPKVTTCYEAIPKLRLIIENKDQARVGFSVCYSNPQLYYP